MKKIIFILLVILNLVNYAQPGKNIPKGNSTQTQDKPSTKNSEKPNSNIITLIVYATTVPCSNNTETPCLQIKRVGNSEYETVEDIEKFNYELGYTYTIQVKEIMKTPPVKSGESIYRYVWVKTLNKKEESETVAEVSIETKRTNTGAIIGKTEINTSSPLDGKWYLRKMKDIDGTSIITDDNIMYIDINIFNDRIDGFGTCNKFATVVQSDNNTKFTISKLTTDYGNCGNKKIEDLFYTVLQQVDKFELRNGNLILSKQWSFLLGFTKNPDNKEEIPITYTPPSIIKNEQSTYATNQNVNKNQDVYEMPIKNSQNNSTTSSSSTNIIEQQKVIKTSYPTETSVDEEAKEMQRKIDELQKELDAKKLKTELEAKKQAELKLALIKEAEIKKQEETKLALAKETEAKKQEEIKLALAKEAEAKKQEELKQAKQNEPEKSSKIKTEKTIEVNKSINNKEVPKQETTNNLDLVESKTIEFVYTLNNNKIISLENSNATFKGNDKNTYLELENSESSVQFIYNKLPKFLIKINENENPENSISLYSCDFKKDKRQIYVRPSKNKILNSFSKINSNEYEIILPENLGEGEYVFINQIDLKNQSLLNSTIKVLSFGITYK